MNGIEAAKFLKEMDLRKLAAFTEALTAISVLRAIGMLESADYVICYKWAIVGFFAANALVHMAKASGLVKPGEAKAEGKSDALAG